MPSPAPWLDFPRPMQGDEDHFPISYYPTAGQVRRLLRGPLKIWTQCTMAKPHGRIAVTKEALRRFLHGTPDEATTRATYTPATHELEI